MGNRGQNISFQAIPVDNNGINVKEETSPPFLHELGNPLLRFLSGSDPLSGSLLWFLSLGVESMPSNHPLNLPGRDLSLNTLSYR